MLVYRLCKSAYYVSDPLSAEGARRAGGRWNPKGYPILYTSATPELALLEVVAHLNPSFVPAFHLLVLDVPDSYRLIEPVSLPPDWRESQPNESLATFLIDWLKQPDMLTVSVPSAIVSRSHNYLIHTLHPDFALVNVVESEPFPIDPRVVKGMKNVYNGLTRKQSGVSPLYTFFILHSYYPPRTAQTIRRCAAGGRCAAGRCPSGSVRALRRAYGRTRRVGPGFSGSCTSSRTG